MVYKSQALTSLHCVVYLSIFLHPTNCWRNGPLPSLAADWSRPTAGPGPSPTQNTRPTAGPGPSPTQNTRPGRVYSRPGRAYSRPGRAYSRPGRAYSRPRMGLQQAQDGLMDARFLEMPQEYIFCECIFLDLAYLGKSYCPMAFPTTVDISIYIYI